MGATIRLTSDTLNKYLVGKYKDKDIPNKLTAYNSNMLSKVNELMSDYSILYLFSKSILATFDKLELKSNSILSFSNLVDYQSECVRLLKDLRMALKKYGLLDTDLIRTIGGDIAILRSKCERDKLAINTILEDFRFIQVIQIIEQKYNTSILEHLEYVLTSNDINIFNLELNGPDAQKVINKMVNIYCNIIKKNNITISKENTSSYDESRAVSYKDRHEKRVVKIKQDISKAVEEIYKTGIDTSSNNLYIVAVSTGYKVVFLTKGIKASSTVSKAYLFSSKQEAEDKLNKYLNRLTDNKYRYSEIIKLDIKRLQRRGM